MLKPVSDNPFRILGLTADADRRDVMRAQREIQSSNRLGLSYNGLWEGIEYLGSIERTTGMLNAALTELEDPKSRLRARLLWYHIHPEQFISRLMDEPFDPVLRHNTVLGNIVRLASEDSKYYCQNQWLKVAAEWLSCLGDPLFWSYMKEVEEGCGFSKPLLEEELEEMKDDPSQLIWDIWVSSARGFLEKLDIDSFLRLDKLARVSPLGIAWNAELEQTIIAPIESRMKSAADDIASILRRIDRKADRLQAVKEHNRRLVDEAAGILIRTLKPDLMKLSSIPGIDFQIVGWARDLLTTCLLDISNSYTWADEWEHSNYLLKECADLVDSQSALGLQVLRLLERRGIANT